jgi:hypothetical protein
MRHWSSCSVCGSHRMDLNIDENCSVIMKIDKIGLIWFLWFIKNRLVTIKKIQNSRNFKKLKKLSDKSKTRSIYLFHSNFKFWIKTGRKLIDKPESPFGFRFPFLKFKKLNFVLKIIHFFVFTVFGKISGKQFSSSVFESWSSLLGQNSCPWCLVSRIQLLSASLLLFKVVQETCQSRLANHYLRRYISDVILCKTWSLCSTVSWWC